MCQCDFIYQIAAAKKNCINNHNDNNIEDVIIISGKFKLVCP